MLAGGFGSTAGGFDGSVEGVVVGVGLTLTWGVDDGDGELAGFVAAWEVVGLLAGLGVGEVDFDGDGDTLQAFRWVKLDDLQETDVTFPTDQHVVKLLKTTSPTQTLP